MQTLLDLVPPQRERIGSTYFLGLDLGQRQDHSALAIIERAVIATGGQNRLTFELETRVELRLRHISRWPLGTPYHRVTRDVVAKLAAPPLQQNSVLVVDGTGVGAPVVESLKAARPACRRLIPVIITAPGHAHWHEGRLLVPRQDLIAKLQLTVEQHGLRVSARTGHAEEFAAELTNFGQSGVHDDMVMAAALALYTIPRPG